MPDKNLLVLQHFFEADLRIKKEMLSMAPPDDSQYLDEVSISKYTDNINDSLIYIFSELKYIISDMFSSSPLILRKALALEESIKNAFYSCGFDIQKLRSFYQNFISNMSMDFLNAVKDECVGYSFGNTGMTSVQKIKTVNELLHFIHSSILNDENILQSVPLIEEKKNDYEYPIFLRGYNNSIFNQVFESFPNDLDVGRTDIVAVNERKLLMMVRDRGHALTIEISLYNNIAQIDYFVPKLCNINMINDLPGINKVNSESIGATGYFEIPINDLPNTLFDFISRVPMDSDLDLDSFRKF